MKDGTRKELRWTEDGGKKYEGLVDAIDEHCYYSYGYYYLFLSWPGSPQQLLTSNPCPTTLLLKCKGPEKKRCTVRSTACTLPQKCATSPHHTVSFTRPNLQLFTCISSREYDEMEGCFSTQFSFLGRLAKSHGQVHNRRTQKHDEARATTLSLSL